MRHFILDFAQNYVSPFLGVPMSILGLYLLIRCNILLMLCVVTNAGSIKDIKEKRRNLDKARLRMMQKINLPQEDIAIIKEF